MRLDGRAADLDGGPNFSDSVAEHADAGVHELLENADSMLLGADAYRLLSAYWPTEASADQAISPKLNALHDAADRSIGPVRARPGRS